MSDDWPTPREHARAYGTLLGWTLATLLLIGIVAGIVFGVRWLTAPAKGKLQAREQIQSGANRIQAYDHFFNLCAAVQADERSLDAQYQELAATRGQDDRERVLANIAGLTAERQRAIAQYNADASKDYTIGQFRSSRLPYQLPNGDYTKGGLTTCAV